MDRETLQITSLSEVIQEPSQDASIRPSDHSLSELGVISQLNRRIASMEDENRSLKSEIEKLKVFLEQLQHSFCEREKLLTKERNFYYHKLRTIEDVLLTIDNLTEIDTFIQETLYSTEGMEDEELKVSVDSDGPADLEVQVQWTQFSSL